MYRIAILSSLLAVALQAQTLDELISHSLQNHKSLLAIERRLSGFEESLALSQKFANPELSLSVGDVQLSDPANRSIEPMQYQSLTFKQKIPYFGKRDASSGLVNSQKEFVSGSLRQARVRLVKEIKLSVYDVWELEQKLNLVDEYLELIQNNVELSGAYGASSGDGWHVEMSDMQLTLTELKIKKRTLINSLKARYARLSYLSSMEVNSVELDFELIQPPAIETYAKNLSNNPSLKIKIASEKVKNSKLKVKELDEFMDPYVSVGYFHRESFEDYVSFSVGSALPIYERESLSAQRAKKEVLEARAQSDDLRDGLKSSLTIEYATLLNSYEVYKILRDESVLELEHAFELSASRIKSGRNALLYTKLLEKRLKLYERTYVAQASYKRAEAKIEALTGEMK